MVARLGQQSGFVANAFVNVTPCSTSLAWTVGIVERVSQRWSSVRRRTMFGTAAAPDAGAAAIAANSAANRRCPRTAVTPLQANSQDGRKRALCQEFSSTADIRLVRDRLVPPLLLALALAAV